MKKVGFIGLGAMGQPMAVNLLMAGYETYVYARRPEVTKELQEKGAIVCESPGKVAKASEVVITMLPDSREVQEVCKGEHGIFTGAHENLIYIDSSTTDPKSFLMLAAEAAELGIRTLDAPVGGGVPNAVAGNLIMLVGGEKNLVESCRDMFETVGQKILYCGPLGSAKSLKLANNLMTALYACLLVEGFSLAKKAGVNRDILLELLNANTMNLLEMLTRRIMKTDFRPGFKVALAQKDLRLALKLAGEHKHPLPLGALAKELYQFAMNQGLEDFDFTALYKLYDREI
ncbi:MAG: NAD(P)-dependent oxidoreductase [Desulfobacterales bacterium]|jgi:3-hydroxyisobutyrate dehydrogenase-like beta-hydroxyacid dehydrogenase